MNQEQFNSENKLERQRKNVANLYDEAARVYDESFEQKAEYQIPGILIDMYKRHNAIDGLILDIGCGTGKIKDYLGDSFIYKGIDISGEMIKETQKRGVEAISGPAEEVLRTFEDKSVDHITALSSLYFIKDLEGLIREFERIARKSIFVSLEQFEPEITEMMRNKGIDIYNHPTSLIEDPTEVIRNVFLWKRPATDIRIYGDIVFKKMEDSEKA